jgi:hypothetical protein
MTRASGCPAIRQAYRADARAVRGRRKTHDAHSSRHKTKVGFSWGQALTLLAALGVIVATVIVATTARAKADRYRSAELAVLRVSRRSPRSPTRVWTSTAPTGPSWAPASPPTPTSPLR